MIERCNYCGKEHETGDGDQYNGMTLKICPDVPPNEIFGVPDWNQWVREYPSSGTVRLVNIGKSKAKTSYTE